MSAPLRVHAVPGDGEAPANALNIQLWGGGAGGGGEVSAEDVSLSVTNGYMQDLGIEDVSVFAAVASQFFFAIFNHIEELQSRVTALENP